MITLLHPNNSLNKFLQQFLQALQTNNDLRFFLKFLTHKQDAFNKINVENKKEKSKKGSEERACQIRSRKKVKDSVLCPSFVAKNETMEWPSEFWLEKRRKEKTKRKDRKFSIREKSILIKRH